MSPGRFTAALMTVLLAVILPAVMLSDKLVYMREEYVTAAVEEYTGRVNAASCLALSDYEYFVDELAKSDAVCETDMWIIRQTVGLRESKENAAHPIRQCGAHVHTQDCYAGHNHTVAGCEFHAHSSDCYCDGSYTHCYRTAYSSAKCTACGGKGSVGNVSVCGSCSGTGSAVKTCSPTQLCSTCMGAGKNWVVCSYCNGAGCAVCDEGKAGGWYKTCTACSGSGKMTCTLCNGTGTRTGTCNTCKGRGTVGSSTICTSCSGAGEITTEISYYECAKCGYGSSTSYGISCGRKLCGYDIAGWQCRITEEDRHPLCPQIITDVQYEDCQTWYIGGGTGQIDEAVYVTMMDGSTKILKGKMMLPEEVRLLLESDLSSSGQESGDYAENAAAPEEHVYEANLEVTGYFLRADNYCSEKFSVKAVLEENGQICSRCKRRYYSDSGECPYCEQEESDITGIIVEADRNTCIQGEEPEFTVYAVRKDSKRLLNREEYWDTFDSEIIGEQNVAVGYAAAVGYIKITVMPRSNSEETGSGEEGGTEIGTGAEGGQEEGGPDHEDGHGTEGGAGTESGPGHETEPGTEGGSDHEDGPGNSDEEETPNHEGAGRYIEYAQVITGDELLMLLQQEGCIQLSSGDVFGISVRIGRRTVASGIVID